MTWVLVLALAAAASLATAIVAGRSVRRGVVALRPLQRTAWTVGTTLLLIAGVLVAHALGVFSIPLVVAAFVVVGVPARLVLGATRGRRRRETEARRAVAAAAVAEPGIQGLLARHEIVVLAVLVSAAALLGGAVAMLVGAH